MEIQLRNISIELTDLEKGGAKAQFQRIKGAVLYVATQAVSPLQGGEWATTPPMPIYLIDYR